MAGFLKSIFGRKEEEPHAIDLTLTEVPAWLDAREKEIHGDLDDMVLASRERAKSAIEILKVQVEGLSRLQPPADQVLSSDRLLEAYGGQLHLVPTEDGVLAMEDTCCDEGEPRHG